MGIIEAFKTVPRYRWVKNYWAKKRYYKAIMMIFNGLPNITFPFKDGKGRRWHPSYDWHSQRCRQEWGSRGHNSMKCWRVYLWRQIAGHMLGGFLLSIIPAITLFFAVDFYLWQWTTPLIVGLLFIVKESLNDFAEERAMIEKEYGAGAQEAKHAIDVVFWIVGASLLPLILSLTKGLHF